MFDWKTTDIRQRMIFWVMSMTYGHRNECKLYDESFLKNSHFLLNIEYLFNVPTSQLAVLYGTR